MNTILNKLLSEMVRREASDLFLTVGAAPSLKVNGRLVQMGKDKLSVALVRGFLDELMAPGLRETFESDNEANFAFSPEGLPRFRANAFVQRNSPGLVIRQIRSEIPGLDSLGLPAQVGDLALAKRGIIFVVGGTGAGKSTSMAAMVQQRNLFGSGHIITIEDPIEYLHQHRNCIITQREVGVDTDSFESALENTLRQAPDCIVIGEIRSREAMQQAIAFAETGHLCMATLHANTAVQAIERILHFFPSDEHDRVRLDLSLNLSAIIAQQLLPKPSRDGMVLCSELLLNTPLIGEKIRANQTVELRGLMTRASNFGMQTFDQSLFSLYRAGKIGYETALAHADSVNDLRLQIKLAEGNATGGKSRLDRAGLRD